MLLSSIVQLREEPLYTFLFFLVTVTSVAASVKAAPVFTVILLVFVVMLVTGFVETSLTLIVKVFLTPVLFAILAVTR